MSFGVCIHHGWNYISIRWGVTFNCSLLNRSAYETFVSSWDRTSRQYERYLIRLLSSIDWWFLFKSPLIFFSACIIPLVRILSDLLICTMSLWVNTLLSTFCCVSFVFEMIFLFLMKIIRSSLHCLNFVGWFDWRSRELFSLVSMKGFLKCWTRLISKNILRWSNDEMYPNDRVLQEVIHWSMSLE